MACSNEVMGGKFKKGPVAKERSESKPHQRRHPRVLAAVRGFAIFFLSLKGHEKSVPEPRGNGSRPQVCSTAAAAFGKGKGAPPICNPEGLPGLWVGKRNKYPSLSLLPACNLLPYLPPAEPYRKPEAGRMSYCLS